MEFIRWFHECSVITNLQSFQGTVWLFLCNVDVNDNIYFRRKKIVDSWLQNSWYYRMNSIQVCVDRFVNMFLTIRFGKHILFRDPSELKFLLVHQNEIAALSSGQKIVIIAKAPWLIFLFFNRGSRNRKNGHSWSFKKNEVYGIWFLIMNRIENK